MTANPVCLRPETTLRQARELAALRGVRHFPVTDAAGRLLGIVSDRDLRSALPSTVLDPGASPERLDEVRADSIMSRAPVTLPRDATLDDALLLFDRHRVGALPVVDHEGLLVGIVTVRDVLAAYRRLFGIGRAGSSLIEVRDDCGPNLMTRIVSALEGGGVVCTRLIRAERDDGGPATVYASVQTYNLHGVHEALRAAGLAAVSRKGGAGAR